MTVDSRPAPAKLTDLSAYEDSSQRLPYWARSTNPIVRRHLGLYWRTMPPEMRPFYILYLTWVVLMGIGILFPPLFGFTMISFLASIMVVPLTMLLYGHVLVHIAIAGARTMQQEMNNNTFQLLQATPMSLPQIFLGKVAAAMWRRMDDIVMIAQIAIAFSPPMIFTVYADIWPVEGGTVALAPLVTLLGTVVVGLRVILEPVMVGVLAVFVGLVVQGRSRAITAAVVLAAFYFFLLNIASRLPAVRGLTTTADGVVIPPNVGLILLVDLVLPIALPLFISLTLLKLAEYIVTRE